MAGFPGVEAPPIRLDGSIPIWLRKMFLVMGQMQQGKLNAVGSATLTASVTSSTLTDARISSESWIGLTPRSSGAAANVTSLYVAALGNGTASIAHASTTAVMNVDYCIIG